MLQRGALMPSLTKPICGVFRFQSNFRSGLSPKIKDIQDVQKDFCVFFGRLSIGRCSALQSHGSFDAPRQGRQGPAVPAESQAERRYVASEEGAATMCRVSVCPVLKIKNDQHTLVFSAFSPFITPLLCLIFHSSFIHLPSSFLSSVPSSDFDVRRSVPYLAHRSQHGR